jgi:hypothetical protein
MQAVNCCQDTVNANHSGAGIGRPDSDVSRYGKQPACLEIRLWGPAEDGHSFAAATTHLSPSCGAPVSSSEEPELLPRISQPSAMPCCRAGVGLMTVTYKPGKGPCCATCVVGGGWRWVGQRKFAGLVGEVGGLERLMSEGVACSGGLKTGCSSTPERG